MLLFLKLLLVPGLVAGVTLAARRWGPRIGGWFTALPVVAGPALCFYAVEQGNSFGAQAARGTVMGVAGIAAFCLTYARVCRRLTWPPSLILGWLAFGTVTVLLYLAQPPILPSLALALGSCAIAKRALPPRSHVSTIAGTPTWDLVLRMCAAGALVFVLTLAAARLGPALSGCLAAFPVAAATLAAFTHAQRGPAAVVAFFHGFLPALITFGLFCFVFAVGVEPLGLPLAVASALAVQLSVHGFMLWRTTRVVAKDLALEASTQ